MILFSGGDASQLPSLDFEFLKSLGFRPSLESCTVNPPLAYAPKVSPELGPLLAKLSAKVKGKSLSDLVFLDVFCGSGGLCAAVRRLGMKLSVGVDSHAQKVCMCPVVSLDLAKPGARAILRDLLKQDNVVACHLSPPVTTSNAVVYCPSLQGLRSASHPDGVPGLQGSSLELVQTANQLFALCAEVWTLCWELGVLCAIAHPGRSIMWLTSPLKACQQTPFLSASLHQCMFGSYRRKATRILHTNPYLQKLALACDGSHAHEPWRAPAQNRQKDSSFPPMLCKAYADAVVSQLVACGVAAPPVALAEAPLSLSLAARVATSSQPTGRKLPPLVPEFACLVRVSGPSKCLPCTQKSKLKSPWPVPSTLRCQPYVPTLPAGAKCLQARPCVGAASALKSGLPVVDSCGSTLGVALGSPLGVALVPSPLTLPAYLSPVHRRAYQALKLYRISPWAWSQRLCRMSPWFVTRLWNSCSGSRGRLQSL